MRGIYYASIKKNIFYNPSEKKIEKVIDYLNDLEADELKKIVLAARGIAEKVSIDHNTEFYCGVDNGKTYVSYEQR